jgi:hypothetical protein
LHEGIPPQRELDGILLDVYGNGWRQGLDEFVAGAGGLPWK